MQTDVDASRMLMVWCDASSFLRCGSRETTTCPCLPLSFCWLGALVGWAVCEMIGHANKLHHFCLCGRGQWATICRRGGGNEWISFMLAPPESPLQQPPPLPTLLGPSWHRVWHRQTSPPSASPPPCCPIEEPTLQFQPADLGNYVFKRVCKCVCCSGMIADD